ncbi:uncharacterized protein LOC142224657 [Haematobia irritans]|uniref:uncharacterized protein LOC142224657 n=1 Tax=Haematobia irritans TaxID=7368 RepID=UPI003F4FD6BA
MTINDCLAALKTHNISTKDWDPILVYLCSSKLPHETFSLWGSPQNFNKDLPTWSDMDKFLCDRYKVVERLDGMHGSRNQGRRSDVHSFPTGTKSDVVCKLCLQEAHSLKNCTQFHDLSPNSRNKFVSQNQMCLNFLSYRHPRKYCKSKFCYMECKRNHHTMLHFPNTKPSSKGSTPTSSTRSCNTTIAEINDHNVSNESPTTSHSLDSTVVTHASAHFSSYSSSSTDRNTILPTAIVTVQKLLLPTKPKPFQIHGIGGNVVANSNYLCTLSLFSAAHGRTISVDAIVPKITRLLPNFVVPRTDICSVDLINLDLADPDFHTPGSIDVLLGSDVMPTILLNGVKNVCKSLIALATIFGWVISGPVEGHSVSSFSILTTELSGDPISQQLKMFWEQEEIPEKRSINSDGGYVVRLPFKEGYQCQCPLGHSRSQALIQYVRMENSLSRKSQLGEVYHNVLQEYLDLDHMQITSSQESQDGGSFQSFYLPHHAVVKPERRSTKVRVVFNASRKTSSGNSLYDVLHVGPTLQSDLITLILRWRLFTGDIEKMTLQQLAHESALKFSQASIIINDETDVDDVLSGAHDIESAIQTLAQLNAMLKSAGFPFKKVTVNATTILDSVTAENKLDSKLLQLHETTP